MALPTTITFGQFKLYLGDGGGSEVFVAPCSFASRALSLSKDLADTVLPDCADSDLPTWVVRDAVSKSASINGEGVMDRGSLATWRQWFEQTGGKNCRLEIAGTGVQGGGYWQGPFHLTQFEIKGGKSDGRVKISVQASSAGDITWVAAA